MSYMCVMLDLVMRKPYEQQRARFDIACICYYRSYTYALMHVVICFIVVFVRCSMLCVGSPSLSLYIYVLYIYIHMLTVHEQHRRSVESNSAP